MADQSEKSVLGKGYLIALGIALVYLLLSPGGKMVWGPLRRSVGLQTTGKSPSSSNAGINAGLVDKELEEYRTSSLAFNEWLLNDETAPPALIEIYRGPRVVSLMPQTTSEGPQRLWPVPVTGTIKSEAAWRAIAGRLDLTQGSRIPPTSDRVGYEVLHISRHNVWFMALYGEESQETPEMTFPDVQRIGITADGRPIRVEFKSGPFMYPGEAVRFSGSDDQIVLGRLWRNAVHFQYQFDEGSHAIDLMCVVLP
jgi:hypothetical protein